jgi:hypothetical protein
MRQNLRRNYTFSDGTKINIPYGVDLNRNFPTGWGDMGSNDPLNDYDYMGPVAGSEPETQAVLNAMKKFRPNIYLNVHCGMQMLGYKTKNDITLKVISLINNISARTGSNTQKLYPPGYSCGGGLVCADGATYSGGNGWFYETTTTMPSTLDEYLKTWYPQAFPIYLALAQAVEKVSTNTTPTPVCGDKVCNGKENCSTCSGDCGSCPLPQNHPPTQSTPLLRASDYPNNTTNANLNCYNQSTSDIDGNKVTNKYRWFRNSTFLSSFTNKTIVNQSYTEVGQSWVCEVTPFDGKLYGTARNSSTLIIRAAPYCGDKICNGKENCSTCSADCGACALPKITGCVLDDASWNENNVLKRVYNLKTCFKDPLNTALKFSVKGNKSIKVVINNGSVDLSAPTNWIGHEHIVFYASSSTGNRSASTNNISLTVNNVPVCGDKVCESGETCSSCASDCRACPVVPSCGDGECNGDEDCDTCDQDCGECPPKSHGGGGGGGGSISSYNPPPANNTVTTPDTTEVEPEPVVVNQSVEENKSVQENILSENQETVTEQPSEVKPEVQATGSVTNGLPLKTTVQGIIILFFIGAALFLYYRGGQDLRKRKATAAGSSKSGYSKLHKYVDLAINHGYSKETVASELLGVGWSEKIVNKIISQHHKDFVVKHLEASGLESSHGEALYDYMVCAHDDGYSTEMIMSDLTTAGWSQDVISALSESYDENRVQKL